MSVSDETGSASPGSSMMPPFDGPYDRVAVQAVTLLAEKIGATAIVVSTPNNVEPEYARMRKLSRAMMPAWKVRQLKVAQNGLCALCGMPIDLNIEREGVVDHDHDTGEIRGVLHRSCNSGEGKVANAAGSWIAKSMKYPAIIAALERLLAYYKRPGTGLIYPTHVDAATAARKSADKRNLAARTRRATIKAQRALRDQRPKE